MILSPESAKIVKMIQFFDIDGVLTDPTEKKINPQILERLKNDIEAGNPIIFETGRGWDWVHAHVVSPLSQKVSSPDILENIFVSVEKGDISVTFEDGQWKEKVLAGEKLSEEFLTDAKHLSEEYEQTMSCKENKRTIFTIEMHETEGLSMQEKQQRLEVFQRQRDMLQQQLEQLRDRYGLGDMYEVDATTVALDIQPKGAGKKRGTQEAIAWLMQKGFKAELYEVFGDSMSDIAMADTLSSEHFPVRLIYVGDGSKLQERRFPFTVDIFDRQYAKGTLQYLKQQEKTP
jgi:HAD superfamily hydrolase (TIGR01484 family)